MTPNNFTPGTVEIQPSLFKKLHTLLAIVILTLCSSLLGWITFLLSMGIVGSFFCSGWNEGWGDTRMVCTIPFFHDYADGFCSFFTLGSFFGPLLLVLLLIPPLLAYLCGKAWPWIARKDRTTGIPLLFIKGMYILCIITIYVFVAMPFLAIARFLIEILNISAITPYSGTLSSLIALPALAYFFYKKFAPAKAFMAAIPSSETQDSHSILSNSAEHIIPDNTSMNPQPPLSLPGFSVLHVVLIGLLVGVVVAVIIVGIFLNNSKESLVDSRLEADDASNKSTLQTLRVRAELYFDAHNESYKGFCDSDEVKNAMFKTQSTCNDGEAGYAVSMVLSGGVIQCVDSLGFSGESKQPLNENTRCDGVVSVSDNNDHSPSPVAAFDQPGWFYIMGTNVHGQNIGDSIPVVSFNLVEIQSGWNMNLVDLQYGDTDLGPVSESSVYEGVLYYIDAQGQLVYLNEDLSTTTVIPLYKDADEIISDYFFKDNTIYYLTSLPSCSDYRGECDSVLRTYNMHDATMRTIANHLESQSVDGFDAFSQDIIYVSNGTGDAGCWYQRFLKINVNTSDQMTGPYFQGCDNAEGYAEETRYLQFIDEISETKNLNSLYWNGEFFEPKEAPVETHLPQYAEMIRTYTK